MTITVLVDNRADPGTPGLGAEHGLSLHLDTGRSRVLFDTGASDLFARNAGLLGVDLARVDAAILSHGHYDHGGGLAAFLGLNARAAVHVGPGALEPHYAAAAGPRRKNVGLDRGALEAFRGRLVTARGGEEAVPGVFILRPPETGKGRPPDISRFTRGTGTSITPDDFSHEIVAVAEVPVPGGTAELVVLTGCSHRGILGVVAGVEERFPGRAIRAIVGGLHLVNPLTRGLAASVDDIEATGEALRDDPAVHRLYAGHCTGEKGFDILRRVLGQRIEQLAVGMRIDA